MKRYRLVHLENDESFLCNYEDNEGDWVKWEDAKAEIERLREDNSALRSALRRLAADATTTANALLPDPTSGDGNG